MYQHLQESRGGIKQEAADPSYEDADETDNSAHQDTKPPIGKKIDIYRGVVVVYNVTMIENGHWKCESILISCIPRSSIR